MQEEYLNFNEQDELKAENDFLKMKLMLENGGEFVGNESEDLPPEIENQFLNNILAFEAQFDRQKTIKVFEKIGQPTHFRPVNDIDDADIGEAWNELSRYMVEQGINLGVCSPNISERELYRFATEELFNKETDDLDLPGWTTNFIYDDFYPDPVYENSRQVEQDLFHDLFSSRNLYFGVDYDEDGFVFNGRHYNDFNQFSEKISRFKSLFDEINLEECTISSCEVKDENCRVNGQYRAIAKNNSNELTFSGKFEVDLVSKQSEYWYFKNIFLEGFSEE